MATLRQKKALAKISENVGMSMGEAMREVGYSEQTSKSPSRMTRTKGWQDLMNKHFPDSKLAALHKKLLEKKEVVILGVEKGVTDWEYTGQPHTDALKALETAYKLKGRYSDEGAGNKTLVINITGETASRYGILPEKK